MYQRMQEKQLRSSRPLTKFIQISKLDLSKAQTQTCFHSFQSVKVVFIDVGL